MMLMFGLSTLVLLAISIALSEKRLFLLHDNKTINTTNKANGNNNSSNSNSSSTNSDQAYKKQLEKYFIDDSFLRNKYMECFANKLIEKDLQKKNKGKYSYKKHNSRSIIDRFKN